MFEQFTDRARRVMQLANQEAMRLNHEYVGTEHILLGLIAEGSGVAINVLRNLDVDPERVRREIEKIVQLGPDMSVGGAPHTPRAKKVIDHAIEEARHLKHQFVGTEHLLLGLIREEDGVASVVLKYQGVRLEDARDEVLNLLGYTQTLDERPSAALFNVQKPAEDVGLKHLPGYARTIVADFDGLIDKVRRGKEELIADQDFERAAALRDVEKALTKQRTKFISQWPNDLITDE